MAKKRIVATLLLLTQLIISKNVFATTVSVFALEAMPFCGVVNDEPAGIAVDILNQATKHGAPEFKFIFDIPWIRATLQVQESDGELMAIIPFTRSKGRERHFKWVAEIMATDYRFYSYQRTQPIKSVDDIKDEIIGVVHGHAVIPMLRTEGLLLDSGARNAQHNALKLRYHRFDVLADSDVIAVYSWKLAGQDVNDLQPGPVIGETKHVYIATGLNFPDEVSARISAAIEKMKNNGELQQIYDKWLQ